MSAEETAEYGAAVQKALGEDPTPLTEVPLEVEEALRYNWASSRSELLFKGVELGPSTHIIGEVSEIYDKDENGELTIPTGRYAQVFGWRAEGLKVTDGDHLARMYLTQAVRAGIA